MKTIHAGPERPWAHDAIPVIDAHHHLWDLSAGHYPWLQDEYDGAGFFLGPYASFCHDFLAPAYRALSRHHPVLATVHIEAERDRAESVDETAWLHAVHRQYGFPNAVVAYADFNAADIDLRLARQAAFPLVRGIRCKPVTSATPDGLAASAGSMLDPRWLAGLALLEKYDLSWDVRVPYWHLEQATQVARDFPRIRIALNHAGLPWDRSKEGLARWRHGLEKLAENANVVIKLSEFGLRDAAFNPVDVQAILRQAVQVFGSSRCMFGSNFPVASLKVGYDTLLDTFMAGLSHLPREQVTAIMAGNAAAFYRID